MSDCPPGYISAAIRLFGLQKMILLSWNSIVIWSFRDGRKPSKICREVIMSTTELQNRSFHILERTRTALKRAKMKPSKREK